MLLERVPSLNECFTDSSKISLGILLSPQRQKFWWYLEKENKFCNFHSLKFILQSFHSVPNSHHSSYIIILIAVSPGIWTAYTLEMEEEIFCKMLIIAYHPEDMNLDHYWVEIGSLFPSIAIWEGTQNAIKPNLMDSFPGSLRIQLTRPRIPLSGSPWATSRMRCLELLPITACTCGNQSQFWTLTWITVGSSITTSCNINFQISPYDAFLHLNK